MAPFWDPKSTKIHEKIDSKRHPKNDRFLDRFFGQVGSILGPKLGPKSRSRRSQNASQNFFKLSKFPSANLAPKFESKRAKNLKIEAWGGTPSDFGTKNGPNFDLGCSCGSRAVFVASWECLGGRFGTVLSGSWVPKWSQLGQKLDPTIDHFLDASWNRFLRGFWWI